MEQPEPRRAVVVGAGPAGTLAAINLVQQGFAVAVYERRPEPSQQARATQHSYPMVLANRATRCFEEVGAQPACCSRATSIPCVGHYANGRLRGSSNAAVDDPYLVTWVVDRVGLSADLLAEARRLCGGRATFHFGACLASVDLAQRRVTFDLQEGRQAEEVVYDLLVGADGASSTVRSAMQEQVPGFSAHTVYRSSTQYKTFHGLPCGGGAGAEGALPPLLPGIEGHRPRQHLYWYDKRGGSLVTFWLSEQGLLDGIVARVDNWEPGSLSRRLREDHPSVPSAVIERIVAEVGGGEGQQQQQQQQQAPSTFGRIVACRHLHGPRVVLLGDAGHCMTGMLGQGCNMALESVGCFAEQLRRCGGDLDTALPRFSAARRRDVAAMQHLELCMVLFTAAGGGAPSGTPVFGLAMRAYSSALILSTVLCGMVLHRLAPSVFKLPMYLFLVLRDGRVSYARALRSCRVMMLGVAAAGAALAVVSISALLWRTGLATAWLAADEL